MPYGTTAHEPEIPTAPAEERTTHTPSMSCAQIRPHSLQTAPRTSRASEERDQRAFRKDHRAPAYSGAIRRTSRKAPALASAWQAHSRSRDGSARAARAADKVELGDAPPDALRRERERRASAARYGEVQPETEGAGCRSRCASLTLSHRARSGPAACPARAARAPRPTRAPPPPSAPSAAGATCFAFHRCRAS